MVDTAASTPAMSNKVGLRSMLETMAVEVVWGGGLLPRTTRGTRISCSYKMTPVHTHAMLIDPGSFS